MSLKLNSSGGGSVTLQEPVTASTLTLNLPAFSGTVATLASVTNNGVLYVNSSGQPTSGSALTFDGTKVINGDGSGSTSEFRTSTTNAAGAGGFLRGYRNAAPTYYVGDAAPIVGGAGDGFVTYVYGNNPAITYINGSEQMRLTSTGLGIGTSTIGSTGISLASSYNVGWVQSAGESVPNIFRQASSAATVLANGYRYTSTANGFASSFSSSFAKTAIALNSGVIAFYTDTAAAVAAGTDVTPSERMRIDSSGNLLVGTTSGAGNIRFEVSNSSDNYTSSFESTNASDPYGPRVRYTASAPNGTLNWFLTCSDTSAARFFVYSNGGIANYSGNNVNLSDRREKTNFAPAKSYLDTICAIPVQTFNYLDQNMDEDDGLTLGVVAQDVQAVAPELVMESNWGTKDEPKMRLSIYQTDLQYALMKALQELKTEFDAYKATHP